jgi:long-chain fatty acid transport protein
MGHGGFRGTLVAAAVAGAAFAGQAGAAGFALIEQNGSGVGNAYAGAAAVAEDASTIFFNPAGMTRLGGRQAVGSLDILKTSAKFNNNGSTPPSLTGLPASGIPLNGTGGDAGDWAFIPAAYLSWEVMPNQLWLGLGVGAPFGLKTEWDSSWMGRFHAIESEVKTININPSIAWKVNQMFSVGGGINAMYLDATLSNSTAYGLSAAGAAGQINPALVGPVAAQAGGLSREGVATVKGDDWGWGWNLGAMINFSPQTRLGLSYRSTTKFTLGGDVSFSNAPTFVAGGGVPAAVAAGLNARFANGGVSADIKLPDTFSVALAHSMDRWQFLADYTWTGWDSVQDLSIYRTGSSVCCLTSTPLNFKNSWRAGLGVNYQLNNEWKLRGGIAYDTTPVQDQYRTPRLPDEDRTWLAAGAQWAFHKQGAFDFGLAYLFMKDGSSNLPNQEAASSVPAGFPNTPKGALVGNYNASVWIFSTQVRWNF